MERQFGLPIAFAAAAHAALLFGFDRSPRAPAAKPAPSTVITVFHLPPPEPQTPPEPEPSSEKSTAAAPDVPLPGLPEPLVLDLNDRPPMTPPPLRPVNTAEIKSILEGSIGTPGAEGKPGWSKDILSSIHLDNPPRTRLQTAPIYPFESKRDGLHGEVFVEFIVDESGSVRDPRVIRSSHRVFEEPTLRAVAKWKFEPGRRDGRIVAFKMAVPVVFSLND